MAIGAATLTSLLTALDWLLSDRQKSRLSNISIAVWNWLDDCQRRRLLVWLCRSRVALVVVLLVSLFCYSLLFMLELWHSDNAIISSSIQVYVRVIGTYIFPGFLLSVIIVFYSIEWLSLSRTYVIFLTKVGYCSGALVLIATLALLAPSKHNFELFSGYIRERSEFVWFNSLVIWGVVFSFIVVLLTTIVLLSLAKLIIRLSTLVMLRIAESPKGPILAVSAITGGIAALFKTVA